MAFGSWTTANNGLTWTRSLAITDSDTKGAANFTGLSITNLAGIESKVVGRLQLYLVVVFSCTPIFRCGTLTKYREVALGTNVYDTSKLVAFKCNTNDKLIAVIGDEIDKFTITGGNTLYNCDLEKRIYLQITSPVIITIEETVKRETAI